jgi:hypothetical protein
VGRGATVIYATIDVDLVTHDKAIAAGPAMYLWTWIMLWLRKHKSSDGFIPRHVVRSCPWGTPQGNLGASSRLALAGLLAEAPDGWSVHNYANKNDTAEVIEKRIQDSRAKQQAYRDRKKKARVDAVVTGNDTVSSGAGAGAHSVFVGGERDPESSGPEPRTPAVPPRTLTHPPPTIEITKQLIDRCIFAGAPKPTADHVQRMLSDRRAKNIVRADWGEELFAWMMLQKRFDARQGPARPSPTSESTVSPYPLFKKAKVKPGEEPVTGERAIAAVETLLDELGAPPAKAPPGPAAGPPDDERSSVRAADPPDPSEDVLAASARSR